MVLITALTSFYQRADTHSVSFLTADRLTADTTRPIIHSATRAHSIEAFDASSQRLRLFLRKEALAFWGLKSI